MVVLQIKIALANGETAASLARKINVHQSLVSMIKNGKRWKYLQIPLDLSSGAANA